MVIQFFNREKAGHESVRAFPHFVLTFHLAMNFVAVFSGEAYNMVCEFLGANWYALVGTLILALGFVVHIIYAFWAYDSES